ncbi:hypothetical protein ACIA8C_35920 [Nocardia sp. NPDC051321]|uniref:hypothetical protein n=1 Tax=Nocardia sp. NPDC051321 TaxID=3364323 RepID=UPI0037987552
MGGIEIIDVGEKCFLPVYFGLDAHSGVVGYRVVDDVPTRSAVIDLSTLWAWLFDQY